MAFVGRESELSQLAGALQRAAEGRPGRVAITGAAGMGSTRLLDELADRASRIPHVVTARGRALESGTGEPYLAVVEALGRALGAVPDQRLAAVVGRAGHDLCALDQGLAARLDELGIDRRQPRLVAPDQLGSRVMEALIGTLERAAAGGVLLLALEDLHWADPATRGFLTSLLRLGRPLPICLVVSYRPEELHRRHPARELATTFRSDPSVERIELAPLDRAELATLVEALLGERPAGDLIAAVVEGSGGNPLVATQLVAAASRLDGVRLSDQFEQVVGARLDALSTAAARVARVLAAAHQPLPPEALLGVRLPDGRITVTSTAEAVASGLVVDSPSGLAVAHELYAEAIEAFELPNERGLLHASLAGLLTLHPARAAWHWEAANRPAEARDAHLAAARVAASVDPGETTLLHQQRALELSGKDTAGQGTMASILEDASRAAAAAGRFRRAAALMRRAIDAHPVDGRGPGPDVPGVTPRRPAGVRRGAAERLEVGALHEELGRQLWAGGDPEGGIAAMEHGLSLMPPGPSRPRAHALASLAQHLMLAGRFAQSEPLAREARQTARQVGPEALRELGHATCTLGVDAAYLGELDRGLMLLGEAADTARRAGRLDDLMRVGLNRTTLLDLDSRRDEALAVVTESIRDAEAGGLAGTYGSFLWGNAADILFQLGRWEESERACRAGMEWQPAGVAWFSPTMYLGLVLVESRADDEAARLVGQTRLQLETVPAGEWTAVVQRAAVSLALWHHDHADAVAVADRAWERVLQTIEPVQIALAASTSLEAAAAATEEGRIRHDWPLVAAAGALVDRVLPEAERRVAVSPLSPQLGARVEADLHLDMARAHRARVRGRPSAEAWARLAEAWAERPMPYLAAKARWWQALALLHDGSDRDAARDALHESWRIAVALPAGPLQAELADLAARARLPLADGMPAWRTAIRIEREPVAMGPGRSPDGQGPQVVPGQPTRHRLAIPVAAEVVAPRTAVGKAIGERLLAAPQPAGTTIFGLSPREMEVLTVICEGRTDREIAERLFISERTVHVHVRRVLAKLGVSSRTQAATMALRQGLVALSAAAPSGTQVAPT